jgi:hypothetical protein
VILRLPELYPDEAPYWQEVLNRHYADCGCTFATATGLVALGGFVVFLWMRSGGVWPLGWLELVAGVGAFIGAAALGKTAGRARARRRARTVAQRLQHLLCERMGSSMQPHRPASEPVHSG